MATGVTAHAARRAAGVYYTPRPLVDYVVGRTLGPMLEGKGPAGLTLRVVDPSCGRGAFLLGAYEFLLDWYLRQYAADRPEARARGPEPALVRTPQGWRLTRAERRRILLRHVYGVDVDADAVDAAKAALVGQNGEPSLLDRNLVAGDALLAPAFRAGGVDWPGTFPAAFAGGGFDAVVGNPPWGQKGVALAKDAEAVRHVRERFPSSAGIFDLFRPFVELSLDVLRPGGRLGLVLPDIVLLKNYERTRRLLLDRTTIDTIDWWGMRFEGAVIDAATVVATRSTAPAGHRVRATVHDPRRPLAHAIGQDEFRRNPRCAFNLFVRPADRLLLDRLATFPRLGDFFEAHEGVHSGNMRDELFVDRPLDDTCRPLLFGRDEIAPYRLRWRGRYVRLGAARQTRGGDLTARRYANLGRRQWHEQPKVLVRRTGDRVIAAVDREGRYASNNFFVVFARAGERGCALTLDGLCALLNSAFLTEHFRMVEPRRGRAFAELKIKHLSAFPLPRAAQTCGELNELGALRGGARDEAEAKILTDQIEVVVREMFEGMETRGAAPVLAPRATPAPVPAVTPVPARAPVPSGRR